MTAPARYCYSPLQPGEIRLLHVKPGAAGPQIQLSLVHVNLNDQLEYEALSYTWGESSNTSTIVVNETGHTLEVTVNCETALRALRKDDEERVLWIDAICIDQSNDEERSGQILHMPDIYRRAKQVIAFLGEASDDSELVMNFIADDLATIVRGSRPPMGESLHRAVDKFLERAYFERVWIIQEILFARDITVVLGDRAAAWNDMSRAVYHADVNRRLDRAEAYRNLIPAVMHWRDPSTVDKPSSLLQFLHATRHCKSSDPRDKVYALLAMTPEKDEAAIAPDYTHTPREIFLSVAKFLLIHHNNLDVLCHCQGASPSYSLPSWVPDWSVCRGPKAIGLPNTAPRPYRADGGRPASIAFEDSETLVLEGRLIDTISKIGPIYHEGVHPTVTLRQWDAMLQYATPDPTSQSARSSFLETVMAYPTYPIPSPYERFHLAWRSMMLNEEALTPENVAAATIIQNFVNKYCHGRCFFITEKGYIGIGPAEMAPGHEVTVLMGGQVPFVLSKSGGDRYKLIGECYVHGFMKEEALCDGDTLDRFYIE
jgi:hypothetical protein